MLWTWMTQKFGHNVCMNGLNSIAIENLSIAQHRDILHYTRIRSGVYWPQLQIFRQGDYVISNVRRLQHRMSGHGTILRVKELLPSGLLLLEGNDGRECYEHSNNCAPCHLPIEDIVHHELAIKPKGFSCFVCGEKNWAATMLVCDQCQHDWRMICLRPPLTSLPYGQYNCSHCRGSSVLDISTGRIQWSCVVSPCYACPYEK